jgi:porphobilinogen synthase
MPGQRQETVATVADAARRAHDAGVGAVLVFGIPARKDPGGQAAAAADGPVPRAVAAIKAAAPALTCMADVCLCEYTDHGHCGVVEGQAIANDPSLPPLAAAAVAYARAGADVVAPSDMMDGRVAALRAALDQAGHTDVVLLSYAAKYASAFYGPFRDAAESPPAFGDRRSHQMDVRNADEALRCIRRDVAEGADAVLVKPAGPCLDVVARAAAEALVPVGAYQVSGEYAAIKAAAQRGWLDERAAALEALTAIARAGAGPIVTYWATDAAGWIGR